MTVIGMQARRDKRVRPGGGRRLTSYLVMPRPKDLVKGWLLVVTYVLGILGTAEVDSQSVLRAVVVLAAVELLVYPARYQWNDIRGFVADQKHPSARDRGRLPGPLHKARAHVMASCAVASARLVIAVSLIVLLPGLHLAGVLIFAVVGVFGVAIVYEMLRSASTGRSSEVPPPVRPGIVLLWLVVGAGYVVRGMLGLALAVDLTGHPTLAVTAAITLWCYGIAFVTSRWAVEATAFATVRNGRLTWTARADQAREHLLALVRWLPKRIDAEARDVCDWAPLNEHTPLSAPWNRAIIAAGAAAAVAGRLLCGICPVQQYAPLALVGGLATAAVVWAAGRRPIVLVMGALLLLGVITVTHAPRPVVAGLPWLLVMGAYLFFTTRSIRKLGRPGFLLRLLRRIGTAAGRLVLGEPTWEALQTRRKPAEEKQAWATSQLKT